MGIELISLPIEFYLQPTVHAAREILGQILAFQSPKGLVAGRIVEAEAYRLIDPASHSFRGKTLRNASMWGPPGHAYIYLIYGIHWCINAVTQPEGESDAVLIRALEPIKGIEIMQENRPTERNINRLCSGPANLCNALGITGALDGADLMNGPLIIAQGEPAPDENVIQTTRIGISNAQELPWRFYVKSSPSVSKRDRSKEPMAERKKR